MLPLAASVIADGDPDAVRRIFEEWLSAENAINADFERARVFFKARSLNLIFSWCYDSHVNQDVRDEANALLEEHKEEFPRLKPIIFPHQ